MSLLPAVLAPSLAVAAPPNAGPTTKSASPCSQRVIPLSVGNQWTYSLVPALNPASDQIARIAPVPPQTVVVTVKAIESAPGRDTVISLEEKTTTNLTKDPKTPLVDERSTSTSIRCSSTKFEVSPDSFWFAGEAGGYLGFRLDSVDRSKGTSFQLTGGRFGQAKWREDLLVRWTRTPHPGSDAKPSSGKLELERQFATQASDPVATQVGVYRAEKLSLLTTGRVTGERSSIGSAGDTKAMELPAGWVSTLWIAEGAGIVQTLNPFAHMYQLTAVTLK